MQHTAAFMSQKQDWTTPQAFFDYWNRIYRFTLDAAASHDNAKCDRYFTEADDALTKDWDGVVWLNPPYGPGIGKWVRKAYQESQKVATVVMLIPARTETRWWHDYVMKADHIALVRRRMRFGGATINAPFPSCVVIFNSPKSFTTQFSTMNRILDAHNHGTENKNEQ